MVKPITVARKDFIELGVKLVNESGLPAFVLIDILNGFIRELTELDKKQYDADLAEYNQSQKKDEEDGQ